MSSRKKNSTADIERRLIGEADVVDAWETPIKVPASNSPRPEWYRRNNIVVLDPDVARVFTDSESVNQALRALAGIIQHQTGKSPSKKP
jgi:hypothetical protein